MQHVAILGSTGSIGTQALAVIAANREKFSVTALAAYQNDQLLEEQIRLFKPELAVLVDGEAAGRLVRRYHGATRILSGEDGLMAAATHEKVGTVLTALVGFSGLKPTLAAIEAGKAIALANKETLVAAGELVMSLAQKKGVPILPVDSEHSAIFQCLQGEDRKTVRRLIITASGGPFRGMKQQQLKAVTVSDCLKHPNWSMGRKITVDSATLANKGLEVMEAHWLYNIPYEQIEVIVHPQSIIHSMVEFCDGSVMAQMGMPDMRLPIQYAFSYPERWPAGYPKLDFTAFNKLTFEKPDTDTFEALRGAVAAGRAGGSMPCVFNAANEIAVYAFLNNQIGFLDIADVIKQTINGHQRLTEPCLEDLLKADSWARQYATQIISNDYNHRK
ncbi:1-deoxy-d-xylulose 5-phosphate reductoisomerase [Lucifera butyrica]|uniref:1-deoxy-D-xylulose 5-phosphate reductoisomerase n=1 Tax=Lucifera butyrica TaxID=1351585 RepID=A0A498RB11_9FIRM|nr:1-deoxy-D-xylulose-5-phosphate reductoisomerase [Lucifera butyrica]VBB08057.1 1-deoxy-d-xylulose 5-phosphate reductoisomerase [Lucifera butyrica]